MNGEDILGQKVSEVAQKIKDAQKRDECDEVTLLLWNSGVEHNVSKIRELYQYISPNQFSIVKHKL